VIEYRCKSCWRLDSHHLRAGFHQSADCPSSRFKTDSRVLFRFLNVQRGEFLHSLDLADRSDADRTSPAPVVLNAQLDVWNGVAYESVPFEETPDGHYLSLTYYETRARLCRQPRAPLPARAWTSARPGFSRRTPDEPGVPTRKQARRGRDFDQLTNREDQLWDGARRRG
jgi:hypothetical protein